jgi:Lon-like protease
VRNIILRLRQAITSGWTVRAGRINIIADAIWILMAPVSLWAIAIVYVPIMGPGLSGFQPWAVAIVTVALMFLCLFLHSLAHLVIAKITGAPSDMIILSPLGDAAQVWPAAPNPGTEFLITLAGPLMQGLLAALFTLLWNLQINLFCSIIAFFLIFFNLGLLAINLIPAFPFDGGRLVRVIGWKILKRPAFAHWLALRLGWGFAAGLSVWSVILLAQHARLSLETAATTFAFAVLIVISLLLHKAWKWDRPEPNPIGIPAMTARSALACLLALPLVAVTIALIPINEGLEAPGFTASVEPMVQMPAQYRHSSTGSLIMVSVIPQAPILAGEWFYAQLDHSVLIQPQEEIVPKNSTAQKESQQSYQMLLDSDTTAIIVGLHLAGYPVDVNDGLTVISILPESPSNGILAPGDVIHGANGQTVVTQPDLANQLKLLNPGASLKLSIERNGQTMDVTVVTMPPADANGPARIGISFEQHRNNFDLPFPIKIVPKKIVGGPSAGLMFTLGVYDMVTGQDITGGRKIAGTGTIDQAGNVGPIGGVQRKVVAAERTGAQYFFSPADNYDDALSAATHITVIKVSTAQEAIDFLKSLPSP